MLFAGLIILIILGMTFYLNSSFSDLSYVSFSGNREPMMNNSTNNAIRFLTANTIRVQKNYENPPDKLLTSLYNINTHVNQQFVNLYYQFPLIGREKSILSLKLEPNTVSSIVDKYGVNNKFIIKNTDGVQVELPAEDVELNSMISEFRKGAWILNVNGSLEVDYSKLVSDSIEFTKPIALHIQNELMRLNCDGYLERVQAVLNFVQFIPYGQPDFDSQNFFSLGVALPPESLVLNYSDCDSKSVLFASILSNLIDFKNIILVVCEVSEESGTKEQHMMVGVKGLGLNDGQKVTYDNCDYQLLETTTPSGIGTWHWHHFLLKNIVPLNTPNSIYN